MHRPIILVVNENTPLHQVVMRTLDHWCSDALLLEAHSMREAWAPLHSFTLTAVIGTDQIPDGTASELLQFARACNPLLPVYFLSSSRRNTEIGVIGATNVYLLPEGLAYLVAALQSLL